MAEFDIAIVGGGLVGLTTALALANNGFKIAVVDPNQREPVLPDDYDPRNFALTLTSIRVLENLGVWRKLDATRNAAIRAMSVRDANSRGHIEFSPRHAGERSFGAITENANLYYGLHTQAIQRAEIEMLAEQVTGTRLRDDYRELSFAGGSTIRAKIVVCCDGGNSAMRSLLGISAQQTPYHQCSLVVNVRTKNSHNHVARQIFHDEGPLAFLPLADEHQCAVVWTNSTLNSEDLMHVTPEVFERRLNEAAKSMVEIESLASERLKFPLYKMHVQKYDAPRAVLVGDSAHIIHPLAGQGLNLGIMDAAALSHVLAPTNSSEADAFLRQPHYALRRYSRWRAGDNHLMVVATDALNKLFGRRESWLRTVRGAGLSATGKVSSLMRLFTRHAMGKAGELPDLAKKNQRTIVSEFR